MVKNGLFLMIFNLLFSVLAWLTMYFPGLDIAAAAAFLVLTYVLTGKMFTPGERLYVRGGVMIIAQLPGLIFEFLALQSWFLHGALTSDWDFILQMWHAPFVPLLSLLPTAHMLGFPISFLAAYGLSPLYIMVLMFRNRHTLGNVRF